MRRVSDMSVVCSTPTVYYFGGGASSRVRSLLLGLRWWLCVAGLARHQCLLPAQGITGLVFCRFFSRVSLRLVLSQGAWARGYAVGLGGKGTPFGSAQREHHASPAAEPGEGAGLRHRHQGQGGQYRPLLGGVNAACSASMACLIFFVTTRTTKVRNQNHRKSHCP